jgi:hypothetical protein
MQELMQQTRPRASQHIAPRAWLTRLTIGVALNGIAWVSAWARVGPLAHYSFFPLWLGFILIVDAITEARSGTSLWRRGGARFAALFAVSAPFWWYFEQLNTRVGNWHYRAHRPFGTGEYIFWASLAFSTVIPAVLGVTELLRTFSRAASSAPEQPPKRLPKRVALAILTTGIVTLALSLLFPRQCFPFLWLSLLLILDPINGLAGEGVFARVQAHASASLVRLMAAGLICGFFWEMWNYRSLPQWYYTVPYVGFGKVFEMPLLGYGGYLPFALEIFVVYQFVRLITRPLHLFPRDFVRI